MRTIDNRHSSSDEPRAPAAARYGFWDAATQFVFAVVGLTLITGAALRLNLQPGATSLLYLIIVVFVSLRAGFVSSTAVSLIAVYQPTESKRTLHRLPAKGHPGVHNVSGFRRLRLFLSRGTRALELRCVIPAYPWRCRICLLGKALTLTYGPSRAS